MNPFKILIFAVVVNSAFAAEAPKDVNLTADDARNQKEVKCQRRFADRFCPLAQPPCEQLADKRLDENSAFYDRQKGLAALQKVCDSKDKKWAGRACEELACDTGEKEGCKEFEKLREL